VHYVSNPHDATAIRDGIAKGKIGKAVVVGAGFIGLEMAEAFTDMWGVETTVVEIFDQIMPRLVSKELAGMCQKHMEEQGVAFHLGETVKAIEGDGRVQRVVTDKRTLEADCVIISVGVIPNDKLAGEAGLNCHERGGIIVDETMRTNDPLIFSGGDCVVVKNLLTGQPMYLPLGSMANRQGRVIGDNLAGSNSKFDGVLGSFVVKTFETSLSGPGMSLDSAKAAGFDAASVLLVQLDRAHFYPTKDLMTLELVYEKGTRRVLGIQGFGNAGDALVGRVNAVAAAMKYGLTIDELSTMELAYAPPFSSAMDILNSVANMADNDDRGLNTGVGPMGFAELWEKRDSGEYCFLDCRENPDAEPLVDKYPDYWCNVPQGEIYQRLEEIPEDKSVVIVCNTGARAYEAEVMLRHKGRKDVQVIRGGMAAIRKLGVDV
jgi:NADPH-dependent 2,4-dienoyl-CoA reductase/sulfur reductase-like enzyme/rhodanese-related sulfurtransferase